MTLVDGEEEPSSLSYRVIVAVADERGVEPTELEPLYYTIDPDSLDCLFAAHSHTHTKTHNQLTFGYAGHRVHIDCDGSIDVAPVDGKNTTHPSPQD